MSKQILEVLFGSKRRVKILKFLFRNIGANFTVKELAGRVQERGSLVKKEISQLLDIGLVKRKR